MTNNHADADVAFIKALAEILNETELTELSVKRRYGEDDYLNVRLSKQAAMLQAPAAAAATASPPPSTAQPAPAEPAGAGTDEDPAHHPGAVASPMVGTAYLSPEPGADPFVSVGSHVDEGETVVIVEAMKTMNHIPAPHSGTVKRILVTDGSPVEYGAPLMIIE